MPLVRIDPAQGKDAEYRRAIASYGSSVAQHAPRAAPQGALS